MKKRLLLLLLLLALLVQPATANAAMLDTNQKCTLNVHYSRDGHTFSGVHTRIYRVARASTDGSFALVPPYSTLGINIYGIRSQREWKDIAATLKSHIVSQQIQAPYTVASDRNGVASFSDLPTGLYLVLGNTAESDSGVYIFEDFMVYLPTPQPNNTFDYDMDVHPKPAQYTPKTEYTVTKLWKDSAFKSQRPTSVTVEIYKDGHLYDTVTLNSENNWTYTWRINPDNDGEWTVAETNVPSTYKVSVSSSDNIFTITNTRESPPCSPPKTGDTFPLWTYVTVMSLSGVLLLCLGIWHKRKNK